MKKSQYNIIKTYNNVLIAFNSLTCALAVVEKQFLDILNSIENKKDISLYDDKLINQMKQGGFIIDDDVNEIDKIIFYRNYQKYDSSKLSLTIAPTLECNFRCIYCYETPHKGIMSSEIQEALINFIIGRAAELKYLDVTWYGGEPWIAKDIVFSLSEKIISLCKENGIRYSSSMVSNGSLILEEDIEKMKSFGISSVQITIDGPEEIHNSRRKSLDNSNTYELLIRNINLLCNLGIYVTIRINIDSTNVDNIDDLLDELNYKIIDKKSVFITFGHILASTSICKSIEGNCINSKEFSETIINLSTKAMKCGFALQNIPIYPRARLNYCGAELLNSFVIAPNGDLYKCWEEIGLKEQKCGNILNPNEISPNMIKWINNNPLINVKCYECNILPICMGGCPHKTRYGFNKYQCDTVKYNLEKVMMLYYGNSISE